MGANRACGHFLKFLLMLEELKLELCFLEPFTVAERGMGSTLPNSMPLLFSDSILTFLKPHGPFKSP